jgi:hypothetical protein
MVPFVLPIINPSWRIGMRSARARISAAAFGAMNGKIRAPRVHDLAAVGV